MTAPTTTLTRSAETGATMPAKTLAEILGRPEGEALDLITITVDQQQHVVRVEYLGPTGVQIASYAATEARRLAAELLDWADRHDVQ